MSANDYGFQEDAPTNQYGFQEDTSPSDNFKNTLNGMIAGNSLPSPDNYKAMAKMTPTSALSAAGTALDYPRSAIGSPILDRINQAVTGKPTTSEWGASGNPRADSILAKDGVPQGGHLSDVAPWLFTSPESTQNLSPMNPMKYAAEKGGMLDISPRGVVGGAADIASDPLTYASMGVNKLIEAAKAGGDAVSPALKALSSIFNPVSNTVEGVGVHNYEKGLAPLISKGEQFGKSDIADTFYKNGIYGRAGTIADMGDKAAEGLKDTRDDLMDTAQAAGAKPDLTNAFEPLVDHLQEMVSDGRLSQEDAHSVLEKAMGSKPSVSNPTLSQMSQWKTDLSNSVPNSAYDVTKNQKMSQQFGKVAAGGNRDEIVRAANEAIPGTGDAINDTNKDLGNLLTVQGVADKQAARAANSKLISPQDVGHAAIAGAASGKPEDAALTLLGRIGAALGNSPGVRTSLGYGLRKAGTGTLSAPLIDAAAANAFKNKANPNGSGNQPVAGVGR